MIGKRRTSPNDLELLESLNVTPCTAQSKRDIHEKLRS